MLATVQDGSARLISRNGYSFTRLLWPVSDALRGFPTSILLDGEVVAINDEGRPDFETLQQRLLLPNGKLPGRLCYMVFDLLHVNGHSLLGRPLEERQAILREMRPALEADAVRLTEGFPPDKAKRLIRAHGGDDIPDPAADTAGWRWIRSNERSVFHADIGTISPRRRGT